MNTTRPAASAGGEADMRRTSTETGNIHIKLEGKIHPLLIETRPENKPRNAVV